MRHRSTGCSDWVKRDHTAACVEMEIHADQSFGDQLIRNSFIWFSLQPLVRAATVHWFVFVIDGCACFKANQRVLMRFERTPRLNQ